MKLSEAKKYDGIEVARIVWIKQEDNSARRIQCKAEDVILYLINNEKFIIEDVYPEQKQDTKDWFYSCHPEGILLEHVMWIEDQDLTCEICKKVFRRREFKCNKDLLWTCKRCYK